MSVWLRAVNRLEESEPRHFGSFELVKACTRVTERCALSLALVALGSAALVGASSAPSGFGGSPGLWLSAFAQVSPQAESALSGFVIDAVTGSPLAGAVVTLYNVGSGGSALQQFTDTKGRFVFSGLPASTGYRLRASRLGYFDGAYGNAAIASQLGQPIALSPGQWRDRLVIALHPPSSIIGTVVDEFGDPAVRAEVQALYAIRSAGNWHFAAGPRAQTDDRGVFRLSNLPEGTYAVSVALHQLIGATVVDGLPAVSTEVLGYAKSYYPGVPSISDARTVTVGPGEQRRGVDFRLMLTPTYAIRGTVAGSVDISRNLVARLVPDGPADHGSLSEVARARIDAGGGFMFEYVPVGRYVVDVRGTTSEYILSPSIGSSLALAGPTRPLAPGESSRTLDINSGPSLTVAFSERGVTGLAWGQAHVTVDRNIDKLVVPLKRAGHISGSISWDSAPPARLPGSAVLRAEPANGSPALTAPQTRLRLTQDPAPFDIEGLLAGEYLLRPDIPGVLVSSITWHGQDYTDRPLDLSAGDDLPDVIVRLRTDGASVSGTVRSKSGEPATDAAVLYFPASSALRRNYGLKPTRLGAVRVSSGEFVVGPVPAGDYCLMAVPAALAFAWQDPDALAGLEGSATRLSLRWGETSSRSLIVVR